MITLYNKVIKMVEGLKQKMDNYDLVIIGGGVGGLVTASGASQLGARVALIEKEDLGGDCLHYGCVPTKRLVHSAKMANSIKKAENFGIEVEGYNVNFKKVMDGMRQVQATIAVNDDPERFRKMGVDVIFGSGKFRDPNTFEINGRRLKGRKFLIATGSSPVTLPIKGLAESGALTNVSILKLEELPKSLVVLGAGPIGMEFAQVFSRLGSKVTVIEKMGNILAREEVELTDELREILTAEGIEIHTCTEVTEVTTETGDSNKSKKVLRTQCVTGEKIIEADEILMAIGRSPNVDGLGLDEAKIKYDKRGGITTDLTLRTSQKHIYACGDVTGPYAFTHTAEYQAGIVISNALFPTPGFAKRKADYRVVPWVTYTDPELARVGLTEAEAIEKFGKDKVAVYRFRFDEVDRAIIEGKGQGMIKLVCDKKARLLGAHLMGPSSGELLHELTLAMKENIPITKISQTIHTYPTLSQAVKRACDQYYKEKLFTGWFPKFTKWIISLGR